MDIIDNLTSVGMMARRVVAHVGTPADVRPVLVLECNSQQMFYHVCGALGGDPDVAAYMTANSPYKRALPPMHREVADFDLHTITVRVTVAEPRS